MWLCDRVKTKCKRQPLTLTPFSWLPLQLQGIVIGVCIIHKHDQEGGLLLHHSTLFLFSYAYAYAYVLKTRPKAKAKAH